MPRSRALARLLWGLALLGIAWAAVAWVSGGVSLTAGSVRIRVSQPLRPFGVSLLAIVLLLVVQGRARTMADARAFVRGLAPRRLAIGLAIGITVTGLTLGSWTASGPDSFAYVSQAALWRQGRLHVPMPLADTAPWPNARATFVPFGYAAPPSGPPLSVPITAPGVPMAMAALQRLGGHAAAFVVTPVAAGALVTLVFLIGRRLWSPGVGLAAAWLVATSPPVLFMLMWPMSDIPAAAVTALLMFLLLAARPAAMAAAGLAGSAAILTRPNMLLVVGAAAAWLLVRTKPGFLGAMKPGFPWDQRKPGFLAGFLLFVLGLLPGLVAFALLNLHLYGSRLASGYGTAGTLLSVDRIFINAGRYATWLTETSPVAWIGVAALVVPLPRIWARAGGVMAAWLLLGISAATCSIYLVYGDFTDWWYQRFLLPAWPALFLSAAAALDTLRRGPLTTLAVSLVVVVAGLAGVHSAISRGVFEIGRGERRYAAIATFVSETTPPDAVIFTMQHAGTVSYYSGRTTLRYDQLDPAWLDRAIAWLTAQGRRPYILVEDWEQPEFESRFAAPNAQGRLSYAPLVAWQSATVTGWVFLYDPNQHDAATQQPGVELERRQRFSASPSGRWAE